MDFKLQPILENEKIRLRPLQQSDFEPLYAVASDPLIWEQHQNSDRHTIENFTKYFNEGIASKGALAILDTKTKKIIGSSRFKIIDAYAGVVEIGWSFLSKDYWGGVYNRAFKKLMVNYALEYFTKVVFYVNPKNIRSQKAMEKLGARRMKYLEESWVLKEDIGVTYAIAVKLSD